MPRPDSMQKVSSRRFLKRSARMPPRKRYGSRRLYRFRFLRGTFFSFFRASGRPTSFALFLLRFGQTDVYRLRSARDLLAAAAASERAFLAFLHNALDIL